MDIGKGLRAEGFELDNEFGSKKQRTEVYINRKTGRGVLIEWFALPEVGR